MTNERNEKYCIKLVKKLQLKFDNELKVEVMKRFQVSFPRTTFHYYQAEMDIQSQLDHKNIVKLHMCFQSESFLLLQLEYCQKNLREYTQEHLETVNTAFCLHHYKFDGLENSS